MYIKLIFTLNIKLKRHIYINNNKTVYKVII